MSVLRARYRALPPDVRILTESFTMALSVPAYLAAFLGVIA